MTRQPAKVHLSLRVENDIAAYIEGIREENEPTSKVYNKVLRAGMDAMRNTQPNTQAQDNSGELITTLKNTVDTLTAQLDVKDAQIAALNETVKGLNANLQAAQSLHLVTTQHKPIEAAEWPTGSHENAQEPRQAPEWVSTPDEHEQAPQPAYTTPTATVRRGGILGAIGRAVFGGR